MPGWVTMTVSSVKALAGPKSMTFTCPRLSIITLAGLMSVDDLQVVRDTGPGHLDHEVGGFLPARLCSGAEALGQVLALDELHRVVVDPLVLADRVDLDHVGVNHVGSGFRLADEPLDVFLVLGQALGKHLQDDSAVQGLLQGIVDDPHAALAELAENLVFAQLNGGIGRCILAGTASQSIRARTKGRVYKPAPA